MTSSADANAGTQPTLEQFLREGLEKGTPGQPFEKESQGVLRIDVDGGVWLRPGAAIAYRGDLKFERLPTIDAETAKDAALRELTPLVQAVGQGRLYCAPHGGHLVRLTGETVFVVWEELLAFEETLHFETTFVGHRLSLTAGGLVAVKLSGHGTFAVAIHGNPLVLPVTPDRPVSTDPHATLAWSGDLTWSLKTDLSWRSVFRHGGQEPFQMFFEGTGHVVVQPHEDPSRAKLHLNPLKRITSLFTGG
jgi:uncharacterized protein (AIM24 family)